MCDTLTRSWDDGGLISSGLDALIVSGLASRLRLRPEMVTGERQRGDRSGGDAHR